MEQRYNIYFAGELLPGQELQAVRQNLARLFNADQATLDKLFSGKAQLLKRDCDEATAAKYKQAMERAGALPLVREISEAKAPVGKMTAAERIAAVARGEEPARAARPQPQAGGDDLSLAAAGSDVLRAEERSTPVVSEVDTSSLDLGEAGSRLSTPGPVPPPAPDTSHLSVDDSGELIPGLSPATAALSPDTSGLSLSDPGTDFSDCAADPVPELELDLSALALSPGGSRVLEEQYGRRDTGEAPATDHIHLEDDQAG